MSSVPSVSTMPVDQYIAQQRERIEHLRSEAKKERDMLDANYAARNNDDNAPINAMGPVKGNDSLSEYLKTPPSRFSQRGTDAQQQQQPQPQPQVPVTGSLAMIEMLRQAAGAGSAAHPPPQSYLSQPPPPRAVGGPEPCNVSPTRNAFSTGASEVGGLELSPGRMGDPSWDGAGVLGGGGAPAAGTGGPMVDLRAEIEENEARRLQVRRETEDVGRRLADAQERVSRGRNETIALNKAEEELGHDVRILEQMGREMARERERFSAEKAQSDREMEQSAQILSQRTAELQAEERRAEHAVEGGRGRLEQSLAELVEVEGRVRLLTQQEAAAEEQCQRLERQVEQEQRRVEERQLVSMEQLRKDVRVREAAMM